jgi:hypothetical protein
LLTLVGVTARDLSRLRAHERAKRLVVLGLVVTVYAAGWLLVAWRASRVGETTCTVERVPDIAYCKLVHHAEDGEEHLLPWDSCERPTRWPPTPVGGAMHCYYFRSFPDSIFFEPRRFVWLTPGRVAFLAAGLVLLALGLLVGMLGRRAPPEGASRAPDDPYRVPEPPPPSVAPPSPPPLAIARRSNTGCAAWIIGTPFAVVGALLVVLYSVLMWEVGGDVDLSAVVVAAVCHAVAFLSVLGLGYRSGLVLDASRGLFLSWWGLGRAWFRHYEPLVALSGALVHEGTTGRGYHYRELELVFESGRWRRRYSVADPDAAAANIVAYLVEAAPKSA